MTTKRLCVQCRWLDLSVEFERGSNYCCMRNGKAITGGILARPACDRFAPLPPSPHWGP